MRLVKWLVVMFVVVGGGLVFLGWLAAQIWLWRGANQLRGDFARLKELATNGYEPYQEQCRGKGQERESLSRGEGKLILWQLRFISEREYLIEAVCSNASREPIRVETHYLPQGLTKISGSGVIVSVPDKGEVDFGQVTGGVTLALVNFKRQVGLVNGATVNQARAFKLPEHEIAQAPVTTCAGWSGVCCANNLSVGQDEALDASDCQACHYACNQKPSLAALMVQPRPVSLDRVVKLKGSSSTVTFDYKLIDTDGYVAWATLDFGDGTVDTASGSAYLPDESSLNHELVRQVSHEYQCLRPACVYQVKLTGADELGATLTESRFNQVRIEQVP